MTDEPSPNDTAVRAQGELDALTSDPKWTERFFNGDVEARQQFGELTAAAARRDDIANALADEPVPDPQFRVYGPDELPARDMAYAIDDLRRLGIPNKAIGELLTGTKPNAQDYAMAKQLLTMRTGDKAWSQRLFEGGAAEKRELTLINMIISTYEGPR